MYFDGVRLPVKDRLIQIFGVGVRQADQSEYSRGWRNTSPIHGRHVQSLSFRNIILLTGCMRTYGFSRHTLFLLTCMRVRFGPLLTYNKAKWWTVPFRNGCWQCWKGYWGSEASRQNGVSCASVDWNPYSTIGFTRQPMRPYNSLTLNLTAKFLHADMQLSTRSNDYWSDHSIFSAMDGLTQSCIFKQKLQNPLISAVLS